MLAPGHSVVGTDVGSSFGFTDPWSATCIFGIGSQCLMHVSWHVACCVLPTPGAFVLPHVWHMVGKLYAGCRMHVECDDFDA